MNSRLCNPARSRLPWFAALLTSADGLTWSAGQVTLDWVRWGNGVILDPQDPGTAADPELTISRDAQALTIGWPSAGGRLQAADALPGTWADAGTENPATIQPSGNARFFRVTR